MEGLLSRFLQSPGANSDLRCDSKMYALAFCSWARLGGLGGWSLVRKQDVNTCVLLIGFHRVPWGSIGFHGVPWGSMGFHGVPWSSMEFHGVPVRLGEDFELGRIFQKNLKTWEGF